MPEHTQELINSNNEKLPNGDHPCLDHDLTVPKFEHVCNVGILRSSSSNDSSSVKPPETHATMSKRRRKEFEANIERLNLHDKVVQGMMGLRDFPDPMEPHILVFTLHPHLHAHQAVRTTNVRWNAEHVTEDKVHSDLWDALIGIDEVGFAIIIWYDGDDDLENMRSNMPSF